MSLSICFTRLCPINVPSFSGTISCQDCAFDTPLRGGFTGVQADNIKYSIAFSKSTLLFTLHFYAPLRMTIQFNKFTPEVLLSAPRRSAAIPNADGTLALFTISTYSFQNHSKSAEIRVLDIKTGHTKLLTNDLNASEPTWLGEKNLIIWLKGGEKGTTSLVLADAENLENK